MRAPRAMRATSEKSTRAAVAGVGVVAERAGTVVVVGTATPTMPSVGTATTITVYQGKVR